MPPARTCYFCNWKILNSGKQILLTYLVKFSDVVGALFSIRYLVEDRVDATSLFFDWGRGEEVATIH